MPVPTRSGPEVHRPLADSTVSENEYSRKLIGLFLFISLFKQITFTVKFLF